MTKKAHKLLLACVAGVLLLCPGSFRLAAQDGDGDAADVKDEGVAAAPAAPVPAPAPVAVAPAEAPVEPEVRKTAKRLKDYNLPGLDKKINLTTLMAWDAVQVIEFLAQSGGLNNVIISKSVTGAGLANKLKFDNVTVGEALEIVLSVNNLAYEVKGDIIKIMSDDEYKAQYGSSFYDNKKVRVVNLKYADPVRLGAMLDKIRSTMGIIVPDAVTGSMILIDTPDKIDEMLAIINKADTSTTTEMKTFILQYAKVEEILPEIEAIRTKEAGSIRSDKRTKTIMVTDFPHKIEKISQLIALFDRRPRQVFIEAKITETTLTDDFSMGINWQHLMQGLDPRFSLQSVSKPGSPTTPIGVLNYNTIIAGGNLEIVLEALKKVGKTEILSNPHIDVLDGQEATIKVIEDQPYKEVSVESGTTNVTGVTYLFKEVGVILHVTPRINDESMITVAIKPEISSISQWYDGPPQEGTPVIRKALAETSVLVKDGVTIIIGGMIKDRTDKGTSKVPLLGSVPLLGRFFRHDTTSSVNTETVVFMTPRIVSGEEPFLRMRDMKKAPKPLRPVGINGEKTMKPVR